MINHCKNNLFAFRYNLGIRVFCLQLVTKLQILQLSFFSWKKV
jgi:hypothetical protein